MSCEEIQNMKTDKYQKIVKSKTRIAALKYIRDNIKFKGKETSVTSTLLISGSRPWLGSGHYVLEKDNYKDSCDSLAQK